MAEPRPSAFWRVGAVRRVDAVRGVVEERGLVSGWLGLTHAYARIAGEVVAWRGEPMTWHLYQQPSGARLVGARTLRVATLIAADLLRSIPAGALPNELAPGLDEASRERARRLLAPVLARWCCEGDAVMTPHLWRAAAAIGAESAGWGR